MKTIVEYLVNNHIHVTNHISNIIDDIDNFIKKECIPLGFTVNKDEIDYGKYTFLKNDWLKLGNNAGLAAKYIRNMSKDKVANKLDKWEKFFLNLGTKYKLEERKTSNTDEDLRITLYYSEDAYKDSKLFNRGTGTRALGLFYRGDYMSILLDEKIFYEDK